MHSYLLDSRFFLRLLLRQGVWVATSHFKPTSLASTGELPPDPLSDPLALLSDPDLLPGPSAAKCRAGSLNVVQAGTLKRTDALPGTWFLRSVRVGSGFEGLATGLLPLDGVFMMEEVWRLGFSEFVPVDVSSLEYFNLPFLWEFFGRLEFLKRFLGRVGEPIITDCRELAIPSIDPEGGGMLAINPTTGTVTSSGTAVMSWWFPAVTSRDLTATFTSTLRQASRGSLGSSFRVRKGPGVPSGC